MSCLHWNNIIIHQYLESIDDMAFSSSFLHSSPKENVTVWRQRSLLFVCHPIARQSQVTMRRRSWSLATMETQLEMLGILYSVALRAENGVRSVIEFFKTFQRALQEISKPEPISECIRRIGGWCWDLSLKNNLNRPFTCRHFGSGICWFGCSVLSAMAWGIMGAQGAKKSDDVSGATESNLNLWSWSLRVTTMWMSTTTRHWDLLELFFFGKRYRNGCQNNNSKYGRVDLEGPRTNVAILYNPFKEPNLPNYNLLHHFFGARNGTWNETCVWVIRVIRVIRVIITSQMLPCIQGLCSAGHLCDLNPTAPELYVVGWRNQWERLVQCTQNLPFTAM